ncbi:hypothetical protein HY522_00440 [bacterium]|nr:hypothetical protein [bacterium]
MSDSRAFDRLRHLLIHRGLPLGYVDRAITELSEHRENGKHDAMADGMDPNLADQISLENLGDIDKLAAVISERMRRRTILGRHPVLFFVIAPVVLLFLTGVLAILATPIICNLIHTMSGGAVKYEGPPPYLYPHIRGFFHFLNFGLLPILALAMCLTARKFFCGFRWAFCASLILGLAGYFFFYHVHIPPAWADPGEFGIGYGFGNWLSPEIFHRRECTLRFLAAVTRLLLPLAAFGLFYYLHSSRRLLKS